VTSTFTFTLIDAASRGVILGKVKNYFNRIRLGNPTADGIGGGLRHICAVSSCQLGAGREFGDSIDPDVSQARQY
jgi:hypothetical protein